VTLTRTTHEDLQRIVELGLSPLYVSVHVTDPVLRKKMLGCGRAFDIMEQLTFLENNYIRFHTQIVVCPGINDGAVLKKTIADLLSLGEGLLSIAVVPVGLTSHRKVPLAPVTSEIARDLCRDVGELSEKDAVSAGFRRIFLADELFIKAGLSIPPARYYEEYPQIENGVGLVRQLLDEWKKTRRALVTSGTFAVHDKKRHWAWVTSHSAYAFIQKIADSLCKLQPHLTVDVIPATNYFFGESVTVAGLLTAKDVIKAVKSRGIRYDKVIVPAVMFNIRGSTLDGYSLSRIAGRLCMPVSAPLTLAELAE
jgi:putative radical SAM enzyme (TIGR03279 family)